MSQPNPKSWVEVVLVKVGALFQYVAPLRHHVESKRAWSNVEGILSVLKNISNPSFINVAVMGKSKCYQILQERIKFPVWCTLPSFLHQSPISKVYWYHNSKHCQVAFGEDIDARIEQSVLGYPIYNVSTREDCCPIQIDDQIVFPQMIQFNCSCGKLDSKHVVKIRLNRKVFVITKYQLKQENCGSTNAYLCNRQLETNNCRAKAAAV